MSEIVAVQGDILHGSITSIGALSGSIQVTGILVGVMSVPPTIPLPYFEGPYSVIPKTTWQSLPTQDKSMSEDVTIRSIPYYEVSNPQGGSTIIIGGNN